MHLAVRPEARFLNNRCRVITGTLIKQRMEMHALLGDPGFNSLKVEPTREPLSLENNENYFGYL